MPNIGWTELIIVIFLVLLLFGANKLPDLARSMGRSARIFKSEVKEMRNEDEAETPALSGWRREAFGEDALKLKRGELALVLDGTRVRVVEVRRAPKAQAG